MTAEEHEEKRPRDIASDRLKVCPECRAEILKAATTCTYCETSLYGGGVTEEGSAEVVPFYLPPMVILGGFVIMMVSGFAATVIILSGILLFRPIQRFISERWVRIPFSFIVLIIVIAASYGLLLPFLSIQTILPEQEGLVPYSYVQTHLNYGAEEEMGDHPEKEMMAAIEIFVSDQITGRDPDLNRDAFSYRSREGGSYRVQGAIGAKNLFQMPRDAHFRVTVRRESHAFKMRDFEFRDHSDWIWNQIFWKAEE